VEVLDANSKSDPAVGKMLTEGIATLDGSGGAKFADRNENDQVAALEAVQTTPFFLKVRGAELESLYSNPAMWKAFGYQGPAYAAGGYIHRGFNDLNWLPDPPESASPKPV
ncbi:MAG TPA: tat (twin-arginine translocation) pathway signal sequence, partial [Methylomirabilota bacterium]|nr:tat (twin-arginine translocation) pathway signal sequence [Methylomirabilota bacterium]